MQRDYTEVKEPRMIEFNRVGMDVEGVLLAIQKVKVKDKPTTQYLCKDDEGELFTFLATYDIARKVRKEHIGHAVMVKYEGEDNTVEVGEGKNKLRRFKVYIAKQREVAKQDVEDSLTITDDDIPF
jgi:hypothetical protein